MIGIIALVGIAKNSAVLVDENKKQYSLNINDCIEFNTLLDRSTCEHTIYG